MTGIPPHIPLTTPPSGDTSPPAWRPTLVALCFLALLAFLAFPCRAVHADDKPSKQELEQGIHKYRIKIRRLQERIQKQQFLTQESEEKEVDVLQELEDIDTRLRNQMAKVSHLEDQVKHQQELIDDKEDAIDKLQNEKADVEVHLQKRMSAYYKMGKVGFLNIIFSTRTLPDLLKFHDDYQTMIAYDQKVIERYRDQIAELENARNAYAMEKGVLEEFIDKAVEEQKQTDKLKTEKKELLTRIRTQKKLYQLAIEEMQEASDKLSSSLVELKSKQQAYTHGFALAKGKLPPPVAGRVVTSFDQEKANQLGIIRKCEGIAIVAPDNSEVRAVAAGTVLFSGYLRGYGNTVIIHHGFQYYTITSRLGTLTLHKGDNVEASTVIGRTSDTATLIDEGLYFEIRHGKIPQDPLQWLDVSQLQLSAQVSAGQEAHHQPKVSVPE